jgi:signal transduction histidine kinase/AmiR/NasT family two-component response regulator
MPEVPITQQGENTSSNRRQFMITMRDVTVERKAEEAQLLAERASAANKAKTQMMQMLSHELRTPLQGIMGVASTSMMDIEDNDKASGSAGNDEGTVTSGAGGVKGPMYDSLSTILASSRLLLTLINNTLDTRKINADMMQKIEFSSVSMMACIRDSFQYCGPFATINEARLELLDVNGDTVTLSQILTNNSKIMTNIMKKKYPVVGNRLRLEQVIVNLLSNGIKYTNPGTSLVANIRTGTLADVLETIQSAPSSSLKFVDEEQLKLLHDKAAEEDSGVTIFSVRDHGKGIPPEEYGKVFGEFQQLDVSTEKDNQYEGGGSGQSSGSGLGLHLSMKFVTLMDGHIWFENCVDGNGGVTFSFYLNSALPQREAIMASSTDDDSGQPKRGSIMNESNGSSDSMRCDDDQNSRFRVLLIDDSMINLKVLARMLNKLKVQHCQTALSGAAALEYLEPIRNDPNLVPNLILCDLQMPGMDGYELMAHLREMNICSSPIVMACSADWGSETEGKCHDNGFDGLLRKPITVTYLQEFLANTKLNYKAI